VFIVAVVVVVRHSVVFTAGDECAVDRHGDYERHYEGEAGLEQLVGCTGVMAPGMVSMTVV
jgi:hypothetical protein